MFLAYENITPLTFSLLENDEKVGERNFSEPENTNGALFWNAKSMLLATSWGASQPSASAPKRLFRIMMRRAVTVDVHGELFRTNNELYQRVKTSVLQDEVKAFVEIFESNEVEPRRTPCQNLS